MNTTRLDVSAYRSAEKLLRHHRPALVLGDGIRPAWIDGGPRFWYAVATPAGREFVLVDPEAGTREPGFDHRAVAADPPRNPLEIPSPDGRFVVFLRDHDLWVRSREDGQERALTFDGDEDHTYGASPDYLMYSPMVRGYGLPHMPPAVAWSPDSTRVLTHRTDQSGVRRTHLVESRPADGGAPALRTQRYAYPGDDRLPLAELVVLDVTTGTAVPAKAEPLAMPVLSPITTAHAWWTADGSAVHYLGRPRDLRTLTLHRLDPETGEVTTLVTETGDTRVEPAQQLTQRPMVRVLTGGEEVLWYSQRDGWGHLYLYDAHTGECRGQVTSGAWAVQEILHVDEIRRLVYFVAAGLVVADPYRRSVCRVGLDGTGFARITDDDLDHVVAMSPDGGYFVDSASTTGTPPVTTVRNRDGDVVVELEQADITRLTATGWSPPEGFRVTAADGTTDIHGVLYRPHGFDPNRRYPVVDHLYPSPAMPRVSPSFDAGWHGYDAEALAALGFVVVAMDGRGTPGRDKAFHDAWTGAGHLDDHVAALRQLAAARPWMDLDRVGTFGISAGGVSVVRAMLDFPDVYRVGVAASGNHDNRYYNPGWTETYDGLTDPPLSNVDIADRLTGKLLLVHGGVDNNVYVDHTLRLADRLIAADKDFDLLIVPSAEHVYTGYEHYVTRRTWDYLVRHLMGAEPPADYHLTPVQG